MNIVENLTALFEERDELAKLIEQHRIYRLRADNRALREIGDEISWFVVEPLELHKRDLPTAPRVVEAVLQLREYGSWEAVYPCGSSVEKWPSALKERISQLAGPLEPLVRAELNEEHHRAVA